MRTISFKFSDGRAELGVLYLHAIDHFLILGGQVGVGLSTLSRAARSCWNSLGETKAAECEGTCIGAFAAGFPDVELSRGGRRLRTVYSRKHGVTPCNCCFN